MCIVIGTIASSVLWLLATGSNHRSLKLEPTGHFHAFFTGDSFFITCAAPPNSGATRLTWQAPNGKDITTSTGRVHVEAAPDDPYGLELVFEDVKYEDRGKYVCSAIIDGREVKTYFVLTVYLSITFWGTPTHQEGNEGDDHMIMCNVRSDPTAIISWYVNGSLILDGPRYTITEDGLFLRNLRPSDYGNYTCRAFVVTPHSSQMKDRDITLYVHYRPVWHTHHMKTAHGTIGSSANMTCAAHSQPPPIFEWFRERKLLGNDKTYKVINQKWKSILQVKIKDPSVFGSYICVVSNTLGEIQRKITLIEGIVPEPPSFSVSSDEPGILKLKFFSTSPNEFLPVLDYRIEWKLSTDSGWHQARYHQAAEGNEFIIQDLSFESEYSIRIAARNAVGYSNYSEEIVQRTRGLIAETVVDGSSMSSSYNSSSSSSSILYLMSFHSFQVFVITYSVFLFTLLNYR